MDQQTGKAMNTGALSPARRDGDTLLYRKILGEGSRTLVFVAGLGGTTRYWEARLGVLTPHFRVVLVDLLGFGNSPKPWAKYSIERHVAALRHTLADLGPVSIIGHSLGASVAAAYAARHPQDVARLILMSLPCFGSQAAAYTYLRKGPARGGFIYTNVLLTMLACVISRRLLGRVLPYIIRDIPREVVEDLVKHTWRSSTSSLWEAVYRYDVANELGTLPAFLKVLCIHGDDDTMAPVAAVRKLAADFSNIELCVLAGLDHHPFLRTPKRCSELIMAFVAKAP